MTGCGISASCTGAWALLLCRVAMGGGDLVLIIRHSILQFPQALPSYSSVFGQVPRIYGAALKFVVLRGGVEACTAAPVWPPAPDLLTRILYRAFICVLTSFLLSFFTFYPLTRLPAIKVIYISFLPPLPAPSSSSRQLTAPTTPPLFTIKCEDASTTTGWARGHVPGAARGAGFSPIV